MPLTIVNSGFRQHPEGRWETLIASFWDFVGHVGRRQKGPTLSWVEARPFSPLQVLSQLSIQSPPGIDLGVGEAALNVPGWHLP